MKFNRAALAVAIVAIMFFSGLPLTEADGDDSDTDQLYGGTAGINLDQIDKFFEFFTGKNLKEYLEDLAKSVGWDLLITPDVDSKFAITRDVHSDDKTITITDKLTGYFLLTIFSDIEGYFPAAGTYEVKEGESEIDFLKRVFIDERSEYHSLRSDVVLGMSLDTELITTIDLATGEMTDAYISVYPLMYTNLDGNIKITTSLDDNNDLKSITIGYEENFSFSDLYGDFQIAVDIDDLKVLGDGEWTCSPTMTETVTRSVVSTDLVNNIWPIIKGIIGEGGKTIGTIPELIINILTSSDRGLDVFDTIKSLTGRALPSISFTGDIAISDGTDEYGYECAILKINRGDTLVEIDYPLKDYAFESSDILDLIPEDLISEETKQAISIALLILGLDHVKLTDITDDQEKQTECNDIQETVENIETLNDQYETDIPQIFIIVTVIVAIAACVATVLMWRGKI